MHWRHRQHADLQTVDHSAPWYHRLDQHSDRAMKNRKAWHQQYNNKNDMKHSAIALICTRHIAFSPQQSVAFYIKEAC